MRELVDPAAASLGAAGRVVTAPEELADAVRDILAADVVTVVPDEEANPDRDETGHRGVFAVGDGRTLVARRRWAPFLHQELARAEALLALLTAVRTNLAGPTVVTCGDGAELVLRVGAVADTDAVVLLHEHCSPATLAGRYRDGMPGAADTGRRGVRDLLTPAHGTSVVAVCGREIVALGQLIDEPGSPAEVTLLVEDGWQRNGVGTALLRRLSDVASARGHDELVASARGNHDVLSRTAVRAGLDPAGSTDDGYLRVTISS
ncbi:GNAT family N-acetyltransferase [Saccharomonospora sp. CUA-673]|uniref:GNAT family N-acetyltransferase n=1 Tax=Saccharomonospora sp. CUA-673 TaxID=1904969 RepID=UPI002101BED7|nr:GNAT family N-acetyltransferase [Saccharomonospora sp. CUA-673]